MLFDLYENSRIGDSRLINLLTSNLLTNSWIFNWSTLKNKSLFSYELSSDYVQQLEKYYFYASLFSNEAFSIEP